MGLSLGLVFEFVFWCPTWMIRHRAASAALPCFADGPMKWVRPKLVPALALVLAA